MSVIHVVAAAAGAAAAAKRHGTTCSRNEHVTEQAATLRSGETVRTGPIYDRLRRVLAFYRPEYRWPR